MPLFPQAQPIDTRFGMDVGNTASYNANQQLLQKMAASMGLAELVNQMESNKANAGYMRAMTEKLQRDAQLDPEIRFADKLAKQQEAQRVAGLEKDIGTLTRLKQGMATSPDTTAMGFESILPTLSQGTRRFFEKPGTSDTGAQGFDLSSELVNQALEAAQAQHPHFSKLINTQTRETGATARNDVSNETKLEIAKLRAKIDEAKAANPQLMTTDKLFAYLASKQNPTKEDLDAMDKILTLKSASAIAKPNTGIAPQVAVDPTTGKPKITIGNKEQPKAPSIQRNLTEDQIKKLKDL